jgi:hypothetical protein
MTERTKFDLQEVSPRNGELTPEEQEATRGGMVSLPQGTRPTGGNLQADPCMGGETSRP